MDSMIIKSAFMKGILNKCIEKLIKKNLGCDVNVSLDDIEILINENASIAIGAHIDCNKEEVKKLLGKIL